MIAGPSRFALSRPRSGQRSQGERIFARGFFASILCPLVVAARAHPLTRPITQDYLRLPQACLNSSAAGRLDRLDRNQNIGFQRRSGRPARYLGEFNPGSATALRPRPGRRNRVCYPATP